MSVFQIISVFFALFMMYLITIHYKKKVLSLTESSAWLSMWFVFIAFALLPDSLRDIVEFLHFTRVFDLLLVMALMVLTVVIFTSYIKQKKSEQRIEDFVRKLSIENTFKRKKLKQ